LQAFKDTRSGSLEIHFPGSNIQERKQNWIGRGATVMPLCPRCKHPAETANSICTQCGATVPLDSQAEAPSSVVKILLLVVLVVLVAFLLMLVLEYSGETRGKKKAKVHNGRGESYCSTLPLTGERHGEFANLSVDDPGGADHFGRLFRQRIRPGRAG
jgi:hypothetical protein